MQAFHLFLYASMFILGALVQINWFLTSLRKENFHLCRNQAKISHSFWHSIVASSPDHQISLEVSCIHWSWLVLPNILGSRVWQSFFLESHEKVFKKFNKIFRKFITFHKKTRQGLFFYFFNNLQVQNFWENCQHIMDQKFSKTNKFPKL